MYDCNEGDILIGIVCIGLGIIFYVVFHYLIMYKNFLL
jgi:hypothetical protein